MRNTLRALVALALVPLLALGCADDGDAGPEPLDTADAALLDGGPEAGTAPTTTVLQPVGDPITRFSLNVGDCFNRYESIDVTTRVGCEMPHQREVFHAESHPAPFGEQWPGDHQMQDYAIHQCYAQFEAFAGILYELSRLEIGAITPTEANFTDSKARYRTITCFVNDAGGDDLVGSMRGKGE